MRLIALLATTLLLALSLAPAAQAQEAIELRPPLKKGVTAAYVSDSKMDATIGSESLPGGPQKHKAHITFEFDLKVVEAHDAGAVVHVTFTRFRAEDEDSTGSRSYDSADPNRQTGAYADVFRTARGKPFVLELDERRRITAIEVPAAAVPASPMSKAIFEQFLGEAALKDALGGIFVIPDAPERATQGETWTSSQPFQTPAMGTLSRTSTFGVERETPERAIIKGDGELAFAHEGGLGEADVKTADVSSRWVWNRQTRLMDEVKVEFVLDASLDAQGVLFDMDLSQKSSIKKVDK